MNLEIVKCRLCMKLLNADNFGWGINGWDWCESEEYSVTEGHLCPYHSKNVRNLAMLGGSWEAHVPS